MHKQNLKDVGTPTTPQDMRRLRREAGDFLRRYGEPVVHLHAFTLDDLRNGKARRCPVCIMEYNEEPRSDCQVCFGSGLVSIEDDPTQWIDSAGFPTNTPTDKPKPLYGGWGYPILTRVVQPDVSTDEFRLTPEGVLTQVQQAQGFAFWQPQMYDQDLLVNVSVAKDNTTINNVFDRFLLRSVMPMTMRGWGIREQNRRYITGQRFEMDKAPSNHPVQNVSVGGVDYEAV
jgi:hypothetical protein